MEILSTSEYQTHLFAVQVIRKIDGKRLNLEVPPYVSSPKRMQVMSLLQKVIIYTARNN